MFALFLLLCYWVFSLAVVDCIEAGWEVVILTDKNFARYNLMFLVCGLLVFLDMCFVEVT